PTGLLPVAENEILILRRGGTISVEGIVIDMPYAIFPEFELSKQYLVFASLAQGGSVATIPLAGNGIFEISSDEALIPSLKEADQDNFAIDVKSHRQLGALRSRLSTR